MAGKMKTKKSLQKRVKVTKSGKFKVKHAFRSHRAQGKTTKQKRQLRKSTIMHPSDASRFANMLHGRRKG